MGGGRQPELILGNRANCQINLLCTLNQLETVTYAPRLTCMFLALCQFRCFPKFEGQGTVQSRFQLFSVS